MDSNFSALHFQAETTWGTDPSPPALKKMRITGESLSYDKETVRSQEVRDDRQVADLVKVGAGASGSVDFELSLGDFQAFLVAALFGELVTLNAAAVTADINHTTGVVTAPSGTFNNARVGTWVRFAGSATAANNGIKRVIAKASNGTTITCAAGSFTASTTAETLTIKGSSVVNGITPTSYTIERKLPISGGYKYERWSGMEIDALTLNFESKQIVKGTMDFIGKISALADDTFNGATPITAAGDDPPVNATNNVAAFLYNGATSSEKFKSISLALKNNLRARDCIGQEGAFSLGIGTANITGSLEAFFRDNDLLAAVRNHSDVALAWLTQNSAGAAIGINLPRVKFASGNAGIEGLDADVMVPIDFEAIRDATTGVTAIISFVPAS